MRAVAVIPARYASSRFPGKPLAPILGRPMVAWVVGAASAAPAIAEVWVATDHDGIATAARQAGARVLLTPSDCPSGTDRVAHVARQLEADVLVNVQGDEPAVEPADIDALARAVGAEDGVAMATLARPIRDGAEFEDPNVVKVVCDAAGNALYFSRSPIPNRRGGGSAALEGPESFALAHLGMYGFTRAGLLEFAGMPPGRLEQLESLEQLRALEAGWKIRVLQAQGDSMGVDRSLDVVRVEELLRRRGA